MTPDVRRCQQIGNHRRLYQQNCYLRLLNKATTITDNLSRHGRSYTANRSYTQDGTPYLQHECTNMVHTTRCDFPSQVTSQQSKFAFVVEKLPAEIAAEVADVLINLPPEKPYEVLRQAILQRTGCSEERKIKDLLTNVTLGNSKPSQLLRRMITLLGNNTISETVLKQMWLEKLQPDIVQILAVLTEVDVHKLASIADKIVDTRPIRQISSVAPSDDPTPDVNQQLHVLTAELKKLSLRLDSIQSIPGRSRSYSTNRHNTSRRRSTSRQTRHHERLLLVP
ncbi:unnamed protein product [Acanthosepion pharaonis]|uniref:DUF7041 domain-containing protein n=1 Tax=Acanthosepion pharaonis TaxID=158019 RepID=A0A812DNY7_ACAPH|nr:unnamed protein product [Sepia pharaonis]